MQALQLLKVGSIKELCFTTIPKPEISNGQVLVEMKAVGLNHRDLSIIKGNYHTNVAQWLPLTLCAEGTGIVKEIGRGVKSLKPGDRVCTCIFLGWPANDIKQEAKDHALGGPLAGVLQEYRLLPEQDLVKPPNYLDDRQSACLSVAYLTAYTALFKNEPLKSGQTILLQGSGGTSMAALQFAKACQARVIVVTKSSIKIPNIKALGADEVIDALHDQDWHKQIAKISPLGVNKVLQVGDGFYLQESLKCCCFGARISLVGMMGNPDRLNVQAIFYRMLHRVIQIDTITTGSRDDFLAMNKFLREKRIYPIIDRTFEFKDSISAFDYFLSQQHIGKVLITI